MEDRGSRIERATPRSDAPATPDARSPFPARMRYVPSPDLAPRVLAGDTRAIARLLTRAESGVEEARSTLDAMFAHAGRAHVVGITGVPGSGKSTLVAKLAAAVRRSGRKIAIVAVDPSSPFSGGSILGDRIRMSELIGDPGVFVRSMATRGALGGLAKGTLEAVDVLDAAGFDMVVIETVGVGQDEVEVARAAHTTVVVSAPGRAGDAEARRARLVIDGLAEGKRLADGDPLRIRQAVPAGRPSGSSTASMMRTSARSTCRSRRPALRRQACANSSASRSASRPAWP